VSSLQNELGNAQSQVGGLRHELARSSAASSVAAAAAGGGGGGGLAAAELQGEVTRLHDVLRTERLAHEAQLREVETTVSRLAEEQALVEETMRQLHDSNRHLQARLADATAERDAALRVVSMIGAGNHAALAAALSAPAAGSAAGGGGGGGGAGSHAHVNEFGAAAGLVGRSVSGGTHSSPGGRGGASVGAVEHATHVPGVRRPSFSEGGAPRDARQPATLRFHEDRERHAWHVKAPAADGGNVAPPAAADAEWSGNGYYGADEATGAYDGEFASPSGDAAAADSAGLAQPSLAAGPARGAANGDSAQFSPAVTAAMEYLRRAVAP
jgi:hypothetical protein